jgi:shikimate kinase
MSKYGNIVLFGFMGTGKTRIGQELARRLDMTFVDMDDLIVERAGKSIPRIFAEDGEDIFREMERKLVSELSRESGYVVATGGGVIKNSDNVKAYAATGLLVCLTASPEVIFERVKDDDNRPLLNTDDKMAVIRKLLDERKKLYATIANQVDTSGLTPAEIADKIVALWRADS